MMIFHNVNFISFTKHFISSSAGWEGNGADGGNEGGGEGWGDLLLRCLLWLRPVWGGGRATGEL